MIDTVKHINELLFRYECVIIPGFGAFLTHHQAAYVEKYSSSFVPPKKLLSFNRQLQTNDGLLANHLAKTYAIPYLEAVQNLREQVQIWKAQIENKMPLYFTGLGTLQSDDTLHWQFTPDSNNIFQATSFGLSPVEISVVPPRETLVIPEQKVIPILSNQVVKEELSAKRRGFSKHFKHAGIAASLAILLGFGGFSLYKQDTQEYNFVQQRIAAQQLENKIHTASFTIANPLPAITLALSSEKQVYHIVAGAFRDLENAEIRVLELKKDGFEARVLRVNSFGLHEVIYSSFNSKEEATDELQKIMQTHNQKAWLLTDQE